MRSKCILQVQSWIRALVVVQVISSCITYDIPRCHKLPPYTCPIVSQTLKYVYNMSINRCEARWVCYEGGFTHPSSCNRFCRSRKCEQTIKEYDNDDVSEKKRTRTGDDSEELSEETSATKDFVTVVVCEEDALDRTVEENSKLDLDADFIDMQDLLSEQTTEMATAKPKTVTRSWRVIDRPLSNVRMFGYIDLKIKRKTSFRGPGLDGLKRKKFKFERERAKKVEWFREQKRLGKGFNVYLPEEGKKRRQKRPGRQRRQRNGLQNRLSKQSWDNVESKDTPQKPMPLENVGNTKYSDKERSNTTPEAVDSKKRIRKRKNTTNNDPETTEMLQTPLKNVRNATNSDMESTLGDLGLKNVTQKRKKSRTSKPDKKNSADTQTV